MEFRIKRVTISTVRGRLGELSGTIEADAKLTSSTAHWDTTLGDYILDCDDIRATGDPHATALAFARSAVKHACAVCGWTQPTPPVRAEEQHPSAEAARSISQG